MVNCKNKTDMTIAYSDSTVSSGSNTVPKLQKQYEIKNDVLYNDLAYIKQVLTVVESLIKAIVQGSTDHVSEVQAIESAIKRLLRAVSNKQYKQSCTLFNNIIYNYLLKYPLNPSYANNTLLKSRLISFFQLYFWTVEQVLQNEDDHQFVEPFRNGKVLNDIGFFFFNIDNQETDTKGGQASAGIYNIDPVLVYLTTAIQFKYNLVSTTVYDDIKFKIDGFFHIINFDEFNKLSARLVEAKAISFVDGIYVKKESDTTDEALQDYEISKLKYLVILIEFYLDDINFAVKQESSKPSASFFDQETEKFIDSNRFTATNRTIWISKTREFQSVKKSLLDHVEQKPVSDPHGLPKQTPQLSAKEQLIKEKKQQIYKKFSRKHPHINVDHKIQTEGLEKLSSFTPEQPMVSADNGFSRNLRILIQYNLLGSKKFRAVLVGLLLNLMLLVAFYKNKKRLNWLKNVKNKLWKS